MCPFPLSFKAMQVAFLLFQCADILPHSVNYNIPQLWEANICVIALLIHWLGLS